MSTNKSNRSGLKARRKHLPTERPRKELTDEKTTVQATRKPATKATRQAAVGASTSPVEGPARLFESSQATAFASRVPPVPDSELLENCRTKWQYGAWYDLTQIEDEAIAQDPERAKLAMLLAVAHHHTGDPMRSRKLAMQAITWGGNRRAIARLLISAACNDLGRIAVCLDEPGAAATHFTEAIRLVEPRADVELLAQTRQLRETSAMGLLSEAVEMFGAKLHQPPDALPPDSARLAELTGQFHALQAEMHALRRRQLPQSGGGMLPVHRRRTQVQPPFVIVTAGVPRSGSTWLFNAVRLLCQRSGLNTYGEWCESYQPDVNVDRDIHLVKLHRPDQASFPHDCLVTTHRDLVERIASLIRMGWVKKDVSAIRSAVEKQAELHAYWLGRTNLEVDYEEITRKPTAALARLVTLLELDPPAGSLEDIAKELAELPDRERSANSFGHDATTLMHVGHRGSEQERAELVAFVRNALSLSARSQAGNDDPSNFEQ